MPIQDEVEDLRRPADDHDLLIRLHERVIALGQQIQAFINTTAANYTELKQSIGGLTLRIEKLEQQGAQNSGEKRGTDWVRTALTSVVVGITVGITLYFVNKIGQ